MKIENIELKGTQTEKNLLKAFAGESQARNRYTFFAKSAKREGYEQIAELFTKIADQEMEHAKIFFKYLEGRHVEITVTFPAGRIATTPENLLASANGEHYEWSDLYQNFADVAEKEGFRDVAISFMCIAIAEKEHEKCFRKLLSRVENGTTFNREEEVVWKCRKCGYVKKDKNAPSECPSCNHPTAYFEENEGNY